MKILKINFSNLNSLAGEWSIDLSHPDYTSAGLFVITGQTGAGKTTILDAICLALYGKTPRLGKITKTSNQLMSRHTGECHSEVVFESQKGKFICYWSQQRARKKPDGELQQPKHEICEAETGKVIATKVTEVQDIVEKMTGMKYEQFTRSMLLAQGGFASFISAGPDDKAPILEQITGTDIYSQISKKVHDRYTKESESLEVIKRELEHISVMSPEELNCCTDAIKELKTQADLCSCRISDRLNTIKWKEGLEKIKGEVNDLFLEKEKIYREIESFKSDKELLISARKAAACEESYSSLKERRDEIKALQQKKEEVILVLGEQKKKFKSLENLENLAKIKLSEAEKEQQDSHTVISEVKELISKIADKEASKKTLETERDKLLDEETKLRKNIEINLKNIKYEEGERVKSVLYINEHKSYIDLTDICPRVETQIPLLEEGYLELKKKENEIQNVSKTIEDLSNEINQLQEKINEDETEHDKLKKLVSSHNTSLKETLDGEDLETIIDKNQTLQQRIVTLTDIKNGHEEKKRLQDLISDTTKKITEIKQRILNLSTNEDRLNELVSSHENTLNVIRKNVLFASKIRDLEEERRLLINGEPCPVCGSRTHPFAIEGIPITGTEEDSLKNAEKILSDCKKELQKVIISKEREKAELEQSDRELKKNAEDLNKVEVCISYLKALITPPIEDLTLENLQNMLKEEKSRLTGYSEVIKSATILNTKLKTAIESENKALNNLTNTKKGHSEKLFKNTQKNQEKKRIEIDIDNQTYRIKTLETEINQLINQFNLSVSPDCNLKAIITNLRNRLTTYQNTEQKVEASENRLNDLDKERIKHLSQEESLKNALNKVTSELSILDEDISKYKSRKIELFGDKDPDNEQERVSYEVSKAKESHDTCTKEKHELALEISKDEGKISDLESNLKKTGDLIWIKELEFIEKIQPAGFSDETAFISALLSPDKIYYLQDKDDDLDKREKSIESDIKNAEKRLEEESARDLTPLNIDELRESLKQLEEKKEELTRESGRYEERLSKHHEMMKLKGERFNAMKLQQKETDRWGKLHSLIGSADGKKFRVFAQGITFQILLGHANRYLKQISDRYILVIDSSLPLEMEVIDTWQAGTVRSVKNLSGGEMFLVSLALALGLSGMASRNVRVDSLFLDEGFGTLDEETLDTALIALSSLQQAGKLIGVISHVPALQERISTKIVVKRVTGGRSSLNGPGISRK